MSKALMVGYLESWAPGITFNQAAKNGYNAIVMAFGTIEGNKVNIYNGAFAPSPTPEALKKDIREAKESGAKQILFSVGGENNTYNPNGVPVDELATSIISFAKEYGFTGIDFDLEIDTDGSYLDKLCASIKEKEPGLLITAAPQVNQADHASDLFLVSTANYTIYDQAVQNKRFDYIFIQAYNNGWPKVNGCGETDVCFISEAFKNLKKTIPAETLIAIGEPASKDAAGESSVYYGPQSGSEVYNLMAKQYELIHNDNQFGGVMTWNINKDAQHDYAFVKAMKSVVKSLLSV